MYNCGKSYRSVARRLCAHAIAKCSRLWSDTRGVAATEFVLVVPLFLLIILGSIEFGRGLMAWNDMNHSLGMAVRVVYLDPKKTENEVETLIKKQLETYGESAVTVAATATTVSGTPHMKIQVDFPFNLSIPWQKLSKVTLSVDTLAPVISPIK